MTNCLLPLKNDLEKALDSVLDHGGLDAMIYLCSMVHGYELHSLATSALAALAEHRTFRFASSWVLLFNLSCKKKAKGANRSLTHC